MRKAAPWYRDFYKVTAVLFGGGLLGIAMTVGIYVKTIQNHDDDIKALKQSQSWHALDKRVTLIEDRMSRAKDNAITPAVLSTPSLRPTAGKQR